MRHALGKISGFWCCDEMHKAERFIKKRKKKKAVSDQPWASAGLQYGFLVVASQRRV